MYRYLGGDAVRRDEDVIGLFDMDNASWSYLTRGYLARAERAGRMINAAEDIPRSFVVCKDETVILTQPGSRTLARRLDDQEKTYV